MKTKFIYLVLLVSAMACSKTDTTVTPTPTPTPTPTVIKAGTYKGTEKQYGTGKVYAWLTFSADDKPSSVGVTFNTAALDIVQQQIVVLTMPQEASGKKVFNHILFQLNSGHLPYNFVKHLDVLFYKQDQTEREAIPVYSAANPAGFDLLPPAGVIPKEFRKEAQVAQTGYIWLDSTAPEIAQTGPFTDSFMMTSYRGELTCYAYHVTLDILKNKPAINRAAPMPTVFPVAGYYPTKLSVKQDGDNISVSFDELVLK